MPTFVTSNSGKTIVVPKNIVANIEVNRPQQIVRGAGTTYVPAQNNTPQIVRKSAPTFIGGAGIQGPQGPKGDPGVGSTQYARFEDTILTDADTIYTLSPAAVVGIGLSYLSINGLRQAPSAYEISMDGTQLTVPADLLWPGAELFFEYSY